MSLDSIAQAFMFDEKVDIDHHEYATVSSVNEDGSYQVTLDGASDTTRAARLCNAAANDRVLCIIFNGKCVAIGKVGGDSGAHGIPQGGTSGQVLAKASATDYDVEWVNQSGGGGSGHTYELDGTGTTVRLTADGSANKGNAGTYQIPAASGSNDGTMSAAHYTKLENIEAGAEVNVQSDWNASSGDAAILNKPTIPTAYASDPAMDGTASAGSSTSYAKGDHIHPTDTSRAAAVHTHSATAIVSDTLAMARGGVPTGGTAGQVLAKKTGTDNDLEWVDASSGGSTGTPTALYNDSTGTTGTVALSASANNYTYMRIYFKKTSGQGGRGSVDVYSPHQKYANLTIFEPDSSALWFASRTVYINGTSITTQASSSGQVSASPTCSSASEVAIYRVEAWNVIPAVYPAAVQSGTNLAVE